MEGGLQFQVPPGFRQPLTADCVLQCKRHRNAVPLIPTRSYIRKTLIDAAGDIIDINISHTRNRSRGRGFGDDPII